MDGTMTKLATIVEVPPSTMTSANAGPVLDIRNLRTVFPTIDGDIVAIDDVSFQINPGETVAVVGESGSGKSVTAKSIMRLTDYQGGEVRSGSMLYAPASSPPIDLARMAPGDLRRVRGNEISMIFQEPLTSLNPVLKIGDQIAEAIILHQGKSKMKALAQALEALQLVRISDAERRLMQYPHELSGGMRQRAMIAMALACRPRLLIADEPTTALDVTIQAQILSLIRHLQQEIGMSVMFITHDMGVVAEIADRVVVLWQGRKVEDASVTDIFARPQHPYTKMLLAAVPKLGSMKGMPAPEPFPALDIDGRTIVSVSVARAEGEGVRGHARLRPGQAVLETVGLTTRFPIRKGLFQSIVGNVHAVENVSLKLFPEETLALVGESGCGKSTLGRTVMRLVDPVCGDVIVHGRNITGDSHSQLQAARRHIQMVFQDPYASLNPRMTVAEIIGEPMLIHDRTPKEERRVRAEALLERVGLAKAHLDRYPHEFSGGQRQRICIGRALALNPSIIIADEAVSALDVSIRAQVVNLLMELQREFGISYLFISHDMAVVERVSHRVAVMYMGQIVEIGPREAVISSPRHPYTQRLLESVPVADPRQRRQRNLVTGEISSPVKPLGYAPDLRPMTEVGPGHFVQVH
jgi:ABC-type glutathione transport system ATPase component